MNKIAALTGSIGNLGPIWKDELQNLGYLVHCIDLPSDVSSYDDMVEEARRCISTLGQPDVIINNAAYDPKPSDGGGDFWEYDRIIDVNLKGALNVVKAFIKDLINKKGLVINIGSIMGNSGADWRNYSPGFDKAVGYNVSKAGLIQLSRSITTQYGHFGVRAATISFGPYDSGLPEEFKTKFLHNVPLQRTISEQSLRATLRYAIECPELAGQQVLVDGGLLSW